MNDEWNFGLVSCSIWMLSGADGCLVNVTRRIIYHCTSIFSLRVSACLIVDTSGIQERKAGKTFLFVFSHAITLISRRRYTTAECWSIRDFPLTQKAKISEVRSEVRHVKCTGMGGRFLGDMIDSGGAGRLTVRNGMKTSCPFTKTKRN